jgi:hypothetical protein
LTTSFSSEAVDNIIRQRSVSNLVLAGSLDIPLPSKQVRADWERDISQHLALEPGDVEEIPLARTRMRWPDYARCVQAMRDWTSSVGLPGVLAASDISLMACLGARYHHDSKQYSHAAFGNLFLSEDTGWDVHFPAIGVRIPLTRGTAMVFDTGQPHGVIRRGSSGFDIADVVRDKDASQIFLSWEIPIEATHVATALGITFDASPANVLPSGTGQLLRSDLPTRVCPSTGKWLA